MMGEKKGEGSVVALGLIQVGGLGASRPGWSYKRAERNGRGRNGCYRFGGVPAGRWKVKRIETS